MANPIGATIPHSITGVTDSGNKHHMSLNTRLDNKQVRVNSRDFSQATGNSIAFQAKPSQTVTTTGEVIGGEVSPRVQAGVGAGVLKGLHVDCDVKGTTTGNIGALRALELELVDAGASSRNFTGEATFVRVRSNLSPNAISGDHTVIHVEPTEGSLAFTAFAKFASGSAIASATGSAAMPGTQGFIRVKVAGTFYKIPLVAD